MDAQEFKKRFMPYHRMLYRVAYRLTGNVQEAEDLLQDTYMRLWQKREQIVEETLTEAYLIIIMKNLYRDKMRLKSIDTSADLTERIEPPDDNRPDEKAEREDEAFIVKDLIDHLPQRERNIMTMYLLEEQSYDEIEASTGLKQGNIRQIVMRTRQKLKEQFNKLARTWMN